MEKSTKPGGIVAGLAFGLAVAAIGSMTLGCETYGHNSSLNSNSVAARGAGTWQATPRNAGSGTSGSSLAVGANPNMQRSSEGQYAGAAGASATPMTGVNTGTTTGTPATAGATPVTAPGTTQAPAAASAPTTGTAAGAAAAPAKAGAAGTKAP